MRTTGYSTPVAALIAGAFVSVTLAASILGSVTREQHQRLESQAHATKVSEIISESSSWSEINSRPSATLYLTSLGTQTSTGESTSGIKPTSAISQRPTSLSGSIMIQPLSTLMSSRAPGHYGPVLSQSDLRSLGLSISSGSTQWTSRLLSIAFCESGMRSTDGEPRYYFGSISPQGDGGGLQIKYSVWGHRYDFDRILTEPAYAVWVAWDIYNDPTTQAMYHGDGWGPWGCKDAP